MDRREPWRIGDTLHYVVRWSDGSDREDRLRSPRTDPGRNLPCQRKDSKARAVWMRWAGSQNRTSPRGPDPKKGRNCCATMRIRGKKDGTRHAPESFHFACSAFVAAW